MLVTLDPHRPPAAHAPFDLVVMAGSTGSFDVFSTILRGLPSDFPTPIAVVRHCSPNWPGLAAGLLDRRCALAVQQATAGERPRAGAVYLAPPDRHLLVRPNRRLALARSPRVNFVRPAADPLFTTAARVHGRRVLAVVLTGMGHDGALGAAAIKAAGGTVLVQDPATCAAAAMPRAALQAGCVNFALPPEAIRAALIALCMVSGAANYFGTPLATLPASA